MVNVKKIFLLVVLSLTLIVVDASLSYAAAGSKVFNSLASSTTSFAVGFRNFAYVISGFGIIMFTFLAICGKINFKHLGYIIICLFMLSAVGSMIVYFTDGAPNKVGLQLEGDGAFGKKYEKAPANYKANSSL
jgi:hypothetical protein